MGFRLRIGVGWFWGSGILDAFTGYDGGISVSD